MTSKIFRSTILVAAVVLLCSLGIIMGVLYGYFNDVQIAQLRDELSRAAIGTEENGLTYLQKVDSNRFRITWVNADGDVIYDTIMPESICKAHWELEQRLLLRFEGSSMSKLKRFRWILLP